MPIKFEDIYQNYKIKNYDQVEELLIKATEQCGVLNEVMKKCLLKNDDFRLLNGCLTSLTCSSKKSSNAKFEIYKHILEFLREENRHTEKESSKIVSILSVKAENFPTDFLISLINFYKQLLKSGVDFVGRWTEFLSKLLSLIVLRKDIEIENESKTGIEYKKEVLFSLFECKWSSKTTITLLSTLKDISISKDEIEEILVKCEDVLKKADYQSVPPICYNMMLIAQEQIPNTALDVITSYFNKEEEKQSDQTEDLNSVTGSETFMCNTLDDLHEAQATVILHITHLAQCSIKLMKEYLKFLKGSTWIPRRLLTPFSLSLALSLSSINGYSDQILDSLKSSLLKYFRLKEKAEVSMWLNTTCDVDLNMQNVLCNIAEMCKAGFDQISQGLANLCFSLLEIGGGIKGESYCAQKATEISIKVIPIIIKKEPELASYVIMQLSAHMFTSSSAQHYLEMLSSLSRSSPNVLIDHFELIRGILEQVTVLSTPVAIALLHSMLPLLKMYRSLKDAFVIILRKMLYSREIERRQIAVEGFLLFLCNFRVMSSLPISQGSLSFSSGLSQVSADVHTSFSSNTNEALCLEFLGILRRCFSQQAQVKSVLYYGLYNVIKSNPKLGSSILSTLHKHMLGFIDTREEVFNPIIFVKVFSQSENPVILEPLGELLMCLSDCKWKYECYLKKKPESENTFDNDDDSSVGEISTSMDALCEKLAYISIDDLTTAGVSSSQVVDASKTNDLKAQVLYSIYDALMVYNFHSSALTDHEKAKLFISVFKAQRTFVEKPPALNKDKKEKGKKQSPKTFKSIIKLECAVKMLGVCFEGKDGAEEKCVDVFKRHIDLHMYLISVVDSHIKDLASMSVQSRDKLLNHFVKAAKLLLTQCESSFNDVPEESSKEYTMLSTSIHCLHSLFTIFLKYYKTKLSTILTNICGTDSCNNTLLYNIIKKCQSMSRIIFDNRRSKLIKDSVVIFNIINILSKHMNEGDELSEVQNWLHQICKEQSIESGHFCETIVSVLLHVADKAKFLNMLPRNLAKDVHASLGDHEEDKSMDATTTYQIISQENASSVISPVISSIDETLLQIELVLNVARTSITQSVDIDRKSIEKNIALRIGIQVHALRELLCSAVPHVSFIDQILKSTSKVYSTFCLYVRYYLDLLKMRSNAQLSEKFERLVNEFASFKEDVYKMINYIQSAHGSKKKSGTSQRAMKESMLIPALIFNMEKAEKILLTLSKKSKVKLLINFKLSTSRDFRLNAPSIAKALEEIEETNKDNESEEESENDETVSPSRRQKTQKSAVDEESSDKENSKKQTSKRSRKSSDDESDKEENPKPKKLKKLQKKKK